MANDCMGVMRVVSKSKEAIDRFEKIMKYEDSEFYCYRCRGFERLGDLNKEGDFFVQDFECDSAWNSERWFSQTDDPETLIVKEYDKDGNPVHGTAHFTGIPHLAKLLGFGVEMWSEEPGCGFAEHAVCDSTGWYDYETANYELQYPEDENGDIDDSADPIENNDFGDEYMEFGSTGEIFASDLADEAE